VTVGRRTADDPPDKLSIPFDPYLSRTHFTIAWGGASAKVSKHPSARRPIYRAGSPIDDFILAPGEFFVLGNTRCTLLVEEGSVGDHVVSVITDEQVEHAKRDRAELCLRALTALQPILAARPSVADFLKRIPPLILEILPASHTALVLRLNVAGPSKDVESIDILARSSRAGDDAAPLPSRTMAAIAMRSSKPEAYTWCSAPGAAGSPTACLGVGWAVCAPVKVSEREHYALYAMGEAVEEADPMGDMDQAVLALMAEVASRHLETQFLHLLEGQLVQYFPPALREVLMEDPYSDKLRPALHDVTVLFFDLRGFSKVTEMAEQSADEEDERALFILRHHEFVSEVLSIIADCVFSTGGIVVDYQGDAVMAAWGAPVALDDHAKRACQAAAEIVRQLAAVQFRDTGGVGKRLPFGIGIASGRVLAGNMATREHIKYIVMGSSVNVASRLEGLTKYIRIPVLISGATAEAVRGQVPLRRVARVQPAGISGVLDVFELIMPEECYGTGCTGEDIEKYECALGHFERGAMDDAEEFLQGLPGSDAVRRFLLLQAGQLVYSGLPQGWDGIIRFQSK